MPDKYRAELRLLWIVGSIVSLGLFIAAVVVNSQARDADAADALQKWALAGSLLGWAGGFAAVSATGYFLYLTTSSIATGHDALTRAIQSSTERAATTASTGLNLSPQTIRSLVLRTDPSIEGLGADFVVTPQVRQEVLAEAIRRDPSLADVSDPDGFKRLAASVAELQEEYRLKHELELLRSAQEATALKERRAKEAVEAAERRNADRSERRNVDDEGRHHAVKAELLEADRRRRAAAAEAAALMAAERDARERAADAGHRAPRR